MGIRWHPFFNAVLALAQFVLSLHDFIFPHGSSHAQVPHFVQANASLIANASTPIDQGNATSLIDAYANATLIDPAPFAFHIWWLIYVLATVHAVVDWLAPHHSIYDDAERPSYLRGCFSVSCVLNILWTAVNAWLGWNTLRALNVLLMLISLLPIYIYLIKEALDNLTPRNWVRYFASALAIRMYFAWACITLVLCVTASFQSIRGGFLSFHVYALQLATMLVLMLCGVVYGNDPVIGLVATWALIGLEYKKGDYPPSTAHDLEMLQGAAAVFIPLLLIMIAIAAVYHHCRNQVRSDMPWELAPWSYRSNRWEMDGMKPISEQMPLEDYTHTYGTENYGPETYGTENDYPPFTFSSQSSVEV